MKRLARTLGLVAVVVFGLALTGGAGATAPRAQLRSFQCQRALDPAARGVAVTSVMRPVRGTQGMAVRFDLLHRARGAARYTRVSGSDLGRWILPADRTLGQRSGDLWIVKKPVVDLPAPAEYRFRVTFHWTGAHHRIIGSAVRYSAVCHQPELRPDLLVHRIAPQPATTGTAYKVTVFNAGATAAGRFSVVLSQGGATRAILRLAPHAGQTITLRGPLCKAAAPPTVTIDPAGVIDDPNRANNIAVASCSATTTPF